MKKLNIILFLAAMTILTSCLKDGKVNLPEGASPMTVQWSTTSLDDAPTNSASNIYRTYSRSFDLTPAGKMNLLVNITGGGVAENDITVGVGLKASAVTEYNAKYSTNYTQLPSNMFTMPTSVVIPKGQRSAIVPIVVNTTLFDLSKSYALPVTITSTTAGQISGNYGTVIYTVGAKNQYDGIYTAKGIVVRAGDNVLSGFFSGLSYTLSTTGPNSVTFSQTWATGGGIAGIDGTTITVNPTTNLVTMSSTANPALVNNNVGIKDGVGTPGTGFVNKYDPATKTFYLSFYWGTGPTNRAAQDTLVYKGPR
jgi:hypothetical protein